MVKYGLRDNPLTADPNDCVVQVTDAKSYDKDDIIEAMVKRGTTVTRTDIVALLNLFTEVCADIVAEGSNVNTELFNTSMSVAGVFANAEDTFDAKRHTIKLNIAPGTALREAAAKAKAEKAAGVPSTDPYIVNVADSVNDTVDTVTVGSAMRLVGGKPKFDKADEEQGIFVTQDGAAVRCAQVIENKPSRVVVLLPASVKAGEFTVEVRTKVDNAKRPSKTVKKGVYKKAVTVVAQ